jgi:hypothetical protein
VPPRVFRHIMYTGTHGEPRVQGPGVSRVPLHVAPFRRGRRSSDQCNDASESLEAPKRPKVRFRAQGINLLANTGELAAGIPFAPIAWIFCWHAKPIISIRYRDGCGSTPEC